MSETPHQLATYPADGSGVVTWVHIGDLHMVRSGEQNFRDLQAIVQEVNDLFAGKGVSFAYLPGDIADDGSEQAYTAVRTCLGKLHLPWCAVVGDHDVRERSFENFQRWIDPALYGAFTVGNVRFIRINCFSEPRPDSFSVDDEQLAWAEDEFKQCRAQTPVLLMHCYPSDLKQGGATLTRLIRHYGVCLVGMGHTHYNEISNDGFALYCATRSTGQVEEGPVGYTVISLDGGSVSWHFCELGKGSLVAITSPPDERLITQSRSVLEAPSMEVHVRVWSRSHVHRVELQILDQTFVLEQRRDGVWRASVARELLHDGVHYLTAVARDHSSEIGRDRIRVAIGSDRNSRFSETDQENGIETWPERGLLGTQLGPNKNGRKW